MNQSTSLKGINIISTGMALPQTHISNANIEKTHHLPDQWIKKHIGTTNRFIAPVQQTTSDLAYEAAKNCLQGSDYDAVDAVILSTSTPDVIGIPTAPIIQDQLGLKNCAAYDVRAGCSGMIYAFDNAINLIQSGIYDRILVVASEITSRFTDYQNPTTAAYFSDGAGAILLEATSQESQYKYTLLNSKDKYYKGMHIPIGGSRENYDLDSFHAGRHYWQLCMQTLEAFTIDAFNDLISSMPKTEGVVQKYIVQPPHINAFNKTLATFNIPSEHVYIANAKHGHMASASLAIGLHESLNNGFLNNGDHLLIASAGSGGNYGAIGLSINTI